MKWSQDNNLTINVKKTKEIIIDFRKNTCAPTPLTINNHVVEIVQSHNILGTTFENNLRWDLNSSIILNKARKRLFCLKSLCSFKLSSKTCTMVYKALIESIITKSFLVWFPNSTKTIRRKFNGIVKYSNKITKNHHPTLEELYQKRCIKYTKAILNNKYHPASGIYSYLPHGKRLHHLTGKERFIKSFFPDSIRRFNMHVQEHKVKRTRNKKS